MGNTIIKTQSEQGFKVSNATVTCVVEEGVRPLSESRLFSLSDALHSFEDAVSVTTDSTPSTTEYESANENDANRLSSCTDISCDIPLDPTPYNTLYSEGFFASGVPLSHSHDIVAADSFGSQHHPLPEPLSSTPVSDVINVVADNHFGSNANIIVQQQLANVRELERESQLLRSRDRGCQKQKRHEYQRRRVPAAKKAVQHHRPIVEQSKKKHTHLKSLQQRSPVVLNDFFIFSYDHVFKETTLEEIHQSTKPGAFNQIEHALSDTISKVSKLLDDAEGKSLNLSLPHTTWTGLLNVRATYQPFFEFDAENVHLFHGDQLPLRRLNAIDVRKFFENRVYFDLLTGIEFCVKANGNRVVYVVDMSKGGSSVRDEIVVGTFFVDSVRDTAANCALVDVVKLVSASDAGVVVVPRNAKNCVAVAERPGNCGRTVDSSEFAVKIVEKKVIISGEAEGDLRCAKATKNHNPAVGMSENVFDSDVKSIVVVEDTEKTDSSVKTGSSRCWILNSPLHVSDSRFVRERASLADRKCDNVDDKTVTSSVRLSTYGTVVSYIVPPMSVTPSDADECNINTGTGATATAANVNSNADDDRSTFVIDEYAPINEPSTSVTNLEMVDDRCSSLAEETDEFDSCVESVDGGPVSEGWSDVGSLPAENSFAFSSLRSEILECAFQLDSIGSETMNCNENISEAGPTTAADFESLSTVPFLNDSSELDYISTVGGTGLVAENLRKQSLYVNFDPLVAAEANKTAAHNENLAAAKHDDSLDSSKFESSNDVTLRSNNEKNNSSDVTESPGCENGFVGKLISITPNKSPRKKMNVPAPLDVEESKKVVTPRTSPRFTESDPDDVSKLQSLLLKQMKKEEAFKEEIEVVKRDYEQTLHTIQNAEREISRLKAELESTQENEKKLKNELKERIKSKQQLSAVMGEYEKTISQMLTKRDEEKKEFEATIKKVEAERDSTVLHLNNLENAFNDIHQKYERGKVVNEALKKNEELLQKSLAEYETTVKTVENKYELLKSHATSQLEKANQELELITQSYEKEQAKLKAMLRKSEIQINSLQNALDRKTKENQELTAICDELIVKLSAHSNA